MKTTFFLALALAVMAGAALSAPAAPVILVEQGKARACVVVDQAALERVAEDQGLEQQNHGESRAKNGQEGNHVRLPGHDVVVTPAPGMSPVSKAYNTGARVFQSYRSSMILRPAAP